MIRFPNSGQIKVAFLRHSRNCPQAAGVSRYGGVALERAPQLSGSPTVNKDMSNSLSIVSRKGGRRYNTIVYISYSYWIYFGRRAIVNKLVSLWNIQASRS